MRLGTPDKWFWQADPEGNYSVKYAYSWQRKQDMESVPDFKWLWQVHAPPNIKAFIWKVFWNRIQTRDNLKRGE